MEDCCFLLWEWEAAALLVGISRLRLETKVQL